MDSALAFVSLLFLIMLLFLFVRRIVKSANKFKRKLKYYNSEIERTEGEERQYWIGRRRKHLLKLPIYILK